jgi:pyridoxal phosphate enzyme (YggS family)
MRNKTHPAMAAIFKNFVMLKKRVESMNEENYKRLVSKLDEKKVTLVAVSKTKPAEQILKLYEWGQRDFGENYVQEMKEKYEALPKDIRWHFIGHLQSNKVKYIAPFVHLIHSVDSEKLLKEIDKQAIKNQRVIHCLLQIYIAREETKFGLDFHEAEDILKKTSQYTNAPVIGLMGMASNTDDENQIRREYESLKSFFDKIKSSLNPQPSAILSSGMSSDYEIAIANGSNMVRIGSMLFGKRN